MRSCDVASQAHFDESTTDESSRQGFGETLPAIKCESDAGITNLEPLLARFLDKSLDPFEIPPLRFGKITQGP